MTCVRIHGLEGFDVADFPPFFEEEERELIFSEFVDNFKRRECQVPFLWVMGATHNAFHEEMLLIFSRSRLL